jgi:uncharacterized protein with NRDE domain
MLSPIYIESERCVTCVSSIVRAHEGGKVELLQRVIR